MYQIRHHRDQNILEVTNTNQSVEGKIYLNDGGSLQELKLKNHELIQDLNPLTYEITYASSILFPFANRIKDGKYSFNGQDYQLKTNQAEENNALHGLVFNKTFEVVDQDTSEAQSSITLEYIENDRDSGFPFTYIIQLEYVFLNDQIDINVTITNTDSKSFPFTLGWHPYFISNNLSESTLSFNSNRKLIIGERNITTGVEDIELENHFKIDGKQLDDCWILNSDTVEFKTPKYTLIIEASGENNFLQSYTPPKQNTIAIEPTTGVSNSFNNQIGLQILEAGDTYKKTWRLKIN